MRMRFRWLASLVFAALFWVPSPAHAQNLGYMEPKPWPKLPLPLNDGEKESGLYFAAEMLIFRTDNPLGRQVLAERGLMDVDGTISGTPGAFLGSRETVLKASDAGSEKWSPGYRFTLGWRFMDDTSIYVSGFKMIENRSQASAGILPRNFNVNADFSNSFLFAPFYNFSTFFAGPDNDVLSQITSQPVAGYGITNAFEDIFLDFQQSMWSWEITGKFPVHLIEDVRTYTLIGPRFMLLEESFKLKIVDLSLDGELLNTNVALYRNQWENRLYGVQHGWGIEKYLGGGFAFTAEARVGIFFDDRKAVNRFERGDRGVHDVVQGRKINDAGVCPMFQVGLFLEWFPIDGVQFRAGYEFMGVFNTLRSSFPVDFNVGTLTPHYENKFWRLDGFSVGVALIF